jgi:hypothetical protein
MRVEAELCGGRSLFLTLHQREEPLSVLLPLPLVLAHCFQFGLGAAGILVSPFQVNDQRLLLGEPPLRFNYIALQLPQFIQKYIVKHQPNAPSCRTKAENGPAQPKNAEAVRRLLGGFG